MKSYTDLEQSRKLTEILPIDSADMCWTNHCYGVIRSSMTISAKTVDEYKSLLDRFHDSASIDVFYPAWSLAALLSVLPNSIGRYTKMLCWFDDAWHCGYMDEDSEILRDVTAENSVDACYEMIIELHKLKML